jgi:hypothetical protein
LKVLLRRLYMISSTRVALGIAVLTFLACSSAVAEDTVWAIQASNNEKEPSIFLVGPDFTSSKRLLSSSLIVQSALVTALLSCAPVTVRLKEGSNEEIERVEAFGVGGTSNFALQGEYYVSRIATQRNAITKTDHLEVFVKKGNGKEEPYNVYNLLMQQVLVAAFAASKGPIRPMIDIRLADAQTIRTVTLGQKLLKDMGPI